MIPLKHTLLYLTSILIMATPLSRFAYKQEVVIERSDLAAIDARLHQTIKNAGILISDGPLERHITELTARLTGTPTSAAPPYTVRIINSSELNAFSLSDGTIYISLGLFGMMNNDAQLALLLAHEISHVHRDHHRLFKYELHRKAAGNWFGGGSYNLRVALSGFSKSQEYEADSIAIGMLVQRGFNAWEGKNFFKTMYRWLKYKEKSYKKSSATHPTLAKRYRAIKTRLIRENIDTTSGTIGQTSYQESISTYQEKIVHLLLQSNCVNELYTLALDKLNNHEVHSEWFYLRGTLLQRYFPVDSFAVAHASLSTALRKKPSFTAALRDLGWLYLKNDQPDSARSCLSNYLVNTPQAPDSSLILFYLETLNE